MNQSFLVDELTKFFFPEKKNEASWSGIWREFSSVRHYCCTVDGFQKSSAPTCRHFVIDFSPPSWARKDCQLLDRKMSSAQVDLIFCDTRVKKKGLDAVVQRSWPDETKPTCQSFLVSSLAEIHTNFWEAACMSLVLPGIPVHTSAISRLRFGMNSTSQQFVEIFQGSAPSMWWHLK